MCEFLKYQSQYANMRPADTRPIGTAETTPTVIAYESKYEDEKSDEIQTDTFAGQQTELSERDQMLVALLTENKLGLHDIAEAMGLNLAATNCLLKKLQDTGVIVCEETKRQRLFYAPGKKAE